MLRRAFKTLNIGCVFRGFVSFGEFLQACECSHSLTRDLSDYICQHAGVKVSEGTNPDEKVIIRVGATFGNLSGALIVTEKGVVFLKATGFLRTGRFRLPFFAFSLH